MTTNDHHATKGKQLTVLVSEDVFRSMVRMILTHVWDPIGIHRIGAALYDPIDQSNDDLIAVPMVDITCSEPNRLYMENEYDAYLPTIKAMLLRCAPIEEIYGYLLMVEKVYMEVDRSRSVRWEAAQRLTMIANGCRPFHDRPTINHSTVGESNE